MTTLALYEDLLRPRERRTLPPGNRVLYVASGEASSLGADEAWFGDAEVTVAAGQEGATVLRWELTEWEPDAAKLAAHVELDPWAEYVVRCDRVDLPAGGASHRHVHPGPGIHCLLAGTMLIESPDGPPRTYGPFDAWFERADVPVVATGSADAGTSFVGVLVLPGDSAAEREPAARATTLLDEPISL